jgi:N-acetylneuraminic acid mutarotase
MIVFGGGYGETLNTGGRYDPTANTWTPVRTTNTPDGRYQHTAVWTGSEMIVWGGELNSKFATNSGGRYDPALDAWAPTSTVNAPQGREAHTAVWTGTEMIVWGGWYSDGFNINILNTGGRYNPAADSWTATSLTNAPAPRRWHTAVWTGTEMIVWGGEVSSPVNTGGRYNPKTDSWHATSATNAPAARIGHTAVWTGSEMIVWGGGPYTPTNTGGRYNPVSDSWTATNTIGTAARSGHSAIWTGKEMIVWGGYNGSVHVNTGARYNPGTNTWTATSLSNAPDGRIAHAALWTDNEMIVWGGYSYQQDRFFNTGGRYNPTTDSWTATTTVNAPNAAEYPTAVWTGSRMIVWGGFFSFYDPFGHYTSYVLSTGGRYCAAPPVVTTTPATNVAAYSATLNGSVNPRGLTTTVHFQYGTTTSYGLNTANQGYTGSTYQNVSANISGLSASTTYHFRIVGTNSSGTYYGADRTFTTLSATGPPVVVTNPATLIASFSATLNGKVDPHGLTTTVYFQYGTTTSYGLTTAMQGKTGNTYENVAANISGLSASTIYHFRMVAVNSAGTRYGADRTFTTLSATGPPVVITNPATYVASFSATLNGTVDPHGLTTTVYFQYGTTTSYGSTTASQSKTGNTYQNVGVNISGLAASTTYHFRIVATNSAGTKYGSDTTFTTLSGTGPPVVTTNPATNVTSSSATLNGTVDPHGLTTTVYFQYGTTTSYGHVTTSQSKTGNTYQAVAANISGLSASTTYHFRIVATNSAGTVYGSDRTFTTL